MYFRKKAIKILNMNRICNLVCCRILTIVLFLCAALFSQITCADQQLSVAAQQLRNGFYRSALANYQAALEQSLKSGSAHQQKLAKTGLAHTYYLLNQPRDALKLLQDALLISSQNDPATNAHIHYYLSLIYGHLNNKTGFRSSWDLAMTIAEQESNEILKAYLHLAAIKHADSVDKLNQHLNLIDALFPQTPEIKDSNWGIIQLNLANNLANHRLLEKLESSDRKRIQRIYTALQRSQTHLPDDAYRQLAQISGLKGKLYETDARFNESLVLTVKALSLAKQASASDLLMMYEWQAGRLYKKLQQSQAAIDSFTRAVTQVETIRQDIPVNYQDGRSSFKELLGPLYTDLADLLLLKAAVKNNTEKQVLLKQARKLLEKLKLTEFEDFFQDRCLVQKRDKFLLNQVGENTAIMYPVLLQDRFEWLIGINGQLHQIQIKQNRADLSRQIKEYAADLRRGLANDTNKTLYRLLFQPLESTLNQHNIKTLVYLPDGVLRLLPLSVLSNDKGYLIERFAIATLPGMDLIDAQLNSETSKKSLLVGLSQPSIEAVSQLPTPILSKLTNYSAFSSPNPSQKSLDTTTRSARAALERELISMTDLQSNRSRTLEAIANALALPGVVSEINQLGENLPNQTLLNQDFTLGHFQKEATQSDYNIIHIASHGFFSGDSKDSFIMTYNKLLTIDNLELMLGNRKQNEPISLLTLSACQTAEGDDRAPMGLSGAAIKANAQSALGSLWPINDQAAYQLMTTFYQQWINQHHSKAKALQIAQQQLINNPKTNNPFYWAPFILVGNWL